MSGVSIREAKGFIFDMDGTLLSVSVDWAAVRAKLAELTGRPNFVPLFETLMQVLQTNPELRPRIFKVLDEFEVQGEPEARLFDGSREALELLSRRAKIALVTMQGTKVRDGIMQRFGLTAFFHVLLSREDSLDRAEQLMMAVTRLGLQKNEVVFVGDRLHDLNSAAKIGMGFVLMGDRPGAIAKNFRDMNAFLGFLRNPGG
jgi:HAD superfamily hydrolase (TIGR01549 family)